MDEMPHSTAPLDGGEMGHVMRKKKNTPCMPEAKAVLARTFVDFFLIIELENIGIVYSEKEMQTSGYTAQGSLFMWILPLMYI